MHYQIIGTNVRLAGSMHVVPQGATIPDWVADAYEWSEDLYLEADAADLLKVALLPSGESIEKRLSRDLWAALQARWPEGHASGPLGRQKLWFIPIVLTFASVPILLGVENFIITRAKVALREIKYLETVVEFAERLDAVPDAEYQRAIRLLLREDVRVRAKLLSDMYLAWINRQAAVLWQLAVRSPLAQFPLVRAAVFDGRNVLWLPRIIDMLRADRRTVIFVGAGHLGGIGGLLTLLDEAGFACQPLV